MNRNQLVLFLVTFALTFFAVGSAVSYSSCVETRRHVLGQLEEINEPVLPMPLLHKLGEHVEEQLAAIDDPLKARCTPIVHEPQSPVFESLPSLEVEAQPWMEARKFAAEDWQLVGVAIMGTRGNPPEEIRACLFSGKARFYEEGDRLEGTYCKIKQIRMDGNNLGVQLEHDDGYLIELYFATFQK